MVVVRGVLALSAGIWNTKARDEHVQGGHMLPKMNLSFTQSQREQELQRGALLGTCLVRGDMFHDPPTQPTPAGGGASSPSSGIVAAPHAPARLPCPDKGNAPSSSR